MVNLSLSAIDSAGNALIYSAAGLPDGLTITPTTGIIAGTVADGASAASPFSVTITAADSVNPNVSAGQTFVWVVNPLVFVTNPGSLTSANGDTIRVPISATDSAGNALTFSVSGLTIDAGSGLISGTVGSASGGSPYSVTVTVSAADSRSKTTYRTGSARKGRRGRHEWRPMRA